MPRKLLKRLLPHHDALRRHRHLRLFGTLLHDPNLWHLNRRSVSGAFAIGLFWAMIPIPLQMVAAAASAIVFRVNLPLSVALVWVTNPLTMPPVFYGCYLVGTWLLGKPAIDSHVALNWEWFSQSLGQIWQPLYLGSLLVGIVSAALGYLGMRVFWRWFIVQKLRKRQGTRGDRVPSSS